MSIQNMRVSFSFNEGAVTFDSVNFLLCWSLFLCKSIFPFEPMTIWYWRLLLRELLVRWTNTLSLALIIRGNLVLCKRYRSDLLLLESFIASQIVSENIFKMPINKVVPWSCRMSAEKIARFFARSFVRSFVYSFAHSLMHFPLVYSFVLSFISCSSIS